MSLIEILRVLYDDVLSHRPEEPDWFDRDRCILSKGHGCLALYALLADKGYFPRQALATFCRRSSILGGHPERGKTPGVEASTGALGHGLAIGLGLALAARIKGRDTRVFVVLGDGEINEGSVWESAMSAGKHGVSNLTSLIDYNKLQSYGFTDEVQPLEPLVDKWRSFGFEAVEVDGHDVEALRRVLSQTPVNSSKPTAVVCHTVKGKGIPFAENEPTWHHKSRLPAEQIEAMYEALKDT
jgi:transketolase